MACRQQPFLILLFFSLLSLSLEIRGAGGFHSPTIWKQPTSNKTPKEDRRRLSMTTDSCPNETNKQIYGVPNSGWRSPQWNWGYARGTGHDCAAVCRRRWEDKSARSKLVDSLLEPAKFKAARPESEVPFEEVKLILGLAWQRGRWDGSDGGPGGYAAVLETMAEARRYENEDEMISAINFIEDVSGRFETISRNAEESKRMKSIANDVRGHHSEKEEVFMARRTCAGMVLDAMNFVDNGL